MRCAGSLTSSLFKVANDCWGFQFLMEVRDENIWHATNIWSRFIFLSDQTIDNEFNSIQSLQYLHLFTNTYYGLLCGVLRFTISIFLSYRFCFPLAFRLEGTIYALGNYFMKSKNLGHTAKYLQTCFKCVFINFSSFQSGTTLLILRFNTSFSTL